MAVKGRGHILVTGAGGFAGGFVARYLIRVGYDVMGTFHKQVPNGEFASVCTDLSHSWTIPGKYDAIVHMAGGLPYRNLSMSEYKRSNVDVMQHLINYARRKDIRRVIYFSTIGVYGDFRGNTAVDEETDIINPDAYGLTKYLAECLLREAGLENISLRMPGIIGPGAKPVWFTNTVEKFRRGEKVIIYAPNFKTKNFVWMADVASFVSKLLMTDEWITDRLVLGCRESISIRNAVEEMRFLLDSSSEIVERESSKLPFCVNPSKALEMGYEPLSPREIIREYIVRKNQIA